MCRPKMSEAVFLEPVAPDSAYRLRAGAQPPLTGRVLILDRQCNPPLPPKATGSRIIPEIAHYKLQAQVLSVSRSSQTAADAVLHDGFGSTVVGVGAGALSGAVIGGIAGGHHGAAIGAGLGGLLGGVIATVADASVHDVTYVAVTDVLISERTQNGVIGRRNVQIDNSQGLGGSERQTFAEATDEKRHRTRVVSTANRANLAYEEAEWILAQGLTRSLAGLF